MEIFLLQTADPSYRIGAAALGGFNGLRPASPMDPLLPNLTVPNGAQSLTVGSDGVVSVTLAGQVAPQQIGNLQIADFLNPAGLQPIGENLFLESGASGAAQLGDPRTNGLGALQQHMLESSNVNVAEELVSMIETQRAYEVNSKAIQTTDQMLQYLNQNV